MASGTIRKLFPSLETVGTEYLTNEMFLGKPVYAKIISYGALTANTDSIKEFFTVANNPGHIVRYTAWATLGSSVYYAPYNDGTRILSVNAYWYNSNYWRCRLQLKSNQNMTDAYGCVWYTKE